MTNYKSLSDYANDFKEQYSMYFLPNHSNIDILNKQVDEHDKNEIINNGEEPNFSNVLENKKDRSLLEIKNIPHPEAKSLLFDYNNNKETIKKKFPLIEKKIEGKSTNCETKPKFLTKKIKNYVYIKKHPDKHFGRITKKEKDIHKNVKHTKNNLDDAKKHTIVDCAENLDFAIRYLSNKYHKIELLKLNITPQTGKNDEDLKKLFQKDIKDIYFSCRPRRHTESNSNLLEEKVKKILNPEKPQKSKILELIFNKKFQEIMSMYLEDITYFENKENKKEKIFFEGFITFKHSLKDYEERIKEKIKNNLMNLIETIPKE